MRRALCISALTVFFTELVLVPRPSTAQGTAFTYQGQLMADGQAANGNFDMAFALYNAGTDGAQVGPAITNLATIVTDGLFNVELDFGRTPFTGQALWLQISVRTNAAKSFVALAPLQPLNSTPYAIQSLNASSAASATGMIALSQLPSVVVTNGATNVFVSGTFCGNGSGLTGVTEESTIWYATSPCAVWQSGIITNNANPTNMSGNPGLAQLSGDAIFGTNWVGIFNQGIDIRPINNLTMVIQSNYLYPNADSPGTTNAWGGCGGKYYQGQIYQVVNDFNAANESATGYATSSATMLYVYDTNLALRSRWNLNNGTGFNLEDFAVPANDTEAYFIFFTTNAPWTQTLVKYTTLTSPWTSNGVLDLDSPINFSGGIDYNPSDGNLYAEGQLPMDTIYPFSGYPTNLSSLYAHGAAELFQINPTTGHVVPFLVLSNQYTGGWGAPQFWPGQPNVVYICWNNYFSTGFSNYLSSYNLAATNVTAWVNPDGTAAFANAYAQNLTVGDPIQDLTVNYLNVPILESNYVLSTYGIGFMPATREQPWPAGTSFIYENPAGQMVIGLPNGSWLEKTDNDYCPGIWIADSSGNVPFQLYGMGGSMSEASFVGNYGQFRFQQTGPGTGTFTNNGPVGISGSLLSSAGFASLAAGYGATLYRASATAITNTSANNIQLDLKIVSGTAMKFNAAGVCVTTNDAYASSAGSWSPILQPNGYVTNTSGAVTILGASAF